MNETAPAADTQRPDEPKPGKLQGKQNVYWKPDSNQPRFRGTFTLQHNPEPRAFSLWVNRSKEDPDNPDKKRVVYLSGTGSDTSTSALDKMANKEPPLSEEQVIALTQHTADGFAVKPHEIRLFEAKNADHAKGQPGLYGYYNPADGSPLQRFDVWMRPTGGDRYELSGNTIEYDFDKHLERIKQREAERSGQQPAPEAAAQMPAPGNDNGEEEEEEEHTRKRGRGR